jgi:GNAT superfamily N-acetyltransferase
MIRPAVEADLSEIFAMTRELADFEQMSEEITATEDDFRQALFRPDAVVHATVATADGHDADASGSLAGHALWFRTFSTFLGQTGIWLEDLYVRPDFRRQGIGKALLEDLRSRTDGRVEWDVLEWNVAAIDFYQLLGARPVAGWTRYRWL